eukprot:SAG31_NODE_5593_length_2434_cov_1.981156_3_plen_63_part_00
MGSSSMNSGTALLSELVRNGWVALAINYRKSPQHNWPVRISGQLSCDFILPPQRIECRLFRE